MVNWSGIEDIDAVATRIWLCREKETDPWLPLRHKDCLALNKSPDKPVVIENGRATADPTWGKIRFNYIRGEMLLASATWFIKTDDENDKNKSKQSSLIPMEERDALVAEQLYQNAIYAASSYGKGLGSIDQQLPFIGEEYRVELQKDGGRYLLRKVPTKWFAKSYDLQRGYGAYSLEGEDDEDQLGPVKHVVFVVHGIGEAMFAKEENNFGHSLKDEMTKFRLQVQKRQIENWKKACEVARKKGEEEPPAPNRVEIIPITWYDRIHSSSNEIVQSLHATTLGTIPALREIANNFVFDVLMYMTPSFCLDVLECVTDQIICTYDMFKKNNPNFLTDGGRCSLVGHSLGSVICWDLLSILKEELRTAGNENKDKQGGVRMVTAKDGGSSYSGSSSSSKKMRCRQSYYASDNNNNNYDGKSSSGSQNRRHRAGHYGSWGPSLPRSLDRHLPFEPDFALFLGSPLGHLLTLRGAHPEFDELRKKDHGDDRSTSSSSAAAAAAAGNNKAPSPSSSSAGNKEAPPSPSSAGNEEAEIVSAGNEGAGMVSPFTLPCSSVHNVFSPSDVVAYRIEPLLLPRGTKEIPPPVYLTAQGQGVRFHVKVKHLGDDIRNSMEGTKKSVDRFVSGLLMGSKNEVSDSDHFSELAFPLAGKKRQGRLDFQLQPNLIENEYLRAVRAHSSYWGNTDVVDYFIDLTTNDDDRS